MVTREEFEWLGDHMKTATSVAAMGYVTADIRFGNILLENTRVAGATANYAEMRNIGLAAGRALSPADELHRSPICFIGADVAKKFFANVDPIGKTIRAGTHSYEVVGVAEAIGSAFGQSQDNYMLIPLVTYYKRSEEHTSELQSHLNLVCRLLLEKKKKKNKIINRVNTKPREKRERWITADTCNSD